MKNTVHDIYERNRRRLIKKSKVEDMYLECDVMGVILTIFPNVELEHKLELSDKDKKR